MPTYGVADVADVDVTGERFPVDDVVAKPPGDQPPSNLGITGRYVLTSALFAGLDRTKGGGGRELQLTDAIRARDDVRGVERDGDRYDSGNSASWGQASVDTALRHNDGEMNAAVRSLLEGQFA